MLTLQIVLSGILLGGLYACMAIGFSIIWGVTGLINLAHGSMILIGAYLTWWLHVNDRHRPVPDAADLGRGAVRHRLAAAAAAARARDPRARCS